MCLGRITSQSSVRELYVILNFTVKVIIMHEMTLFVRLPDEMLFSLHVGNNHVFEKLYLDEHEQNIRDKIVLFPRFSI